jgi:hypothetical protein
VPDSPEQGLERKGKILGAGTRISAAGSSVYLAKIFGPAAGVTMAQGLAELGEMLVGALVDWEWRRISRTLTNFKRQVDERLDAGEEVRDEIADPESPGAISVFESVIDAAARSIEEKKCDLIANVYATVTFDHAISVDDALLYLRRIRSASWRQLVALRYVEDRGRSRERELIGVAGAEGEARIHPALGTELSELAGRGLEFIGIGQEDGSVSDPSNTFGGGTITSGMVGRLRATGLGETISRLGRLSSLVSEDELDAIGADLRSDQRSAQQG